MGSICVGVEREERVRVRVYSVESLGKEMEDCVGRLREREEDGEIVGKGCDPVAVTDTEGLESGERVREVLGLGDLDTLGESVIREGL